MKRLLVCSFLIIIAVSICVFSSISTFNKSEEMKSELEEIAQLINGESSEAATKKLNEAEKLWRKTENLFSFIVDADKIEEMNIGFSMIKMHLKDNNIEHALERLRECQLLLEEIAENEKLNIKNIM